MNPKICSQQDGTQEKQSIIDYSLNAQELGGPMA